MNRGAALLTAVAARSRPGAARTSGGRTWDPRNLPPQAGKTFVVTGGSSGIGYFIVEQLVATGARVVVASRSKPRSDAAAEVIRSRYPSADLGFIRLDLGSLASVREASAELLELGGIDGLVENAGITEMPKTREVTDDGFELLFGTNYLGHFALTAQVFPALRPGARVVTIGSISTSLTRANLDDLQGTQKYSPFTAYATSKHATTAFGIELNRRLAAAGSGVSALVADPGFALDGSTPRRPGINEISRGQRFAENLMRPVSHGRDQGAWVTCRALLDPTASGGEFYRPSNLVAGPPMLAHPDRQDLDPEFARTLWLLSEQWTGVEFAPS